jgi:hypothetical protein
MAEKKSLMYGFMTHTTSPVAGNYADSVGERFIGRHPYCINDCSYCYATEIKLKHPEWDKYKGPYRLEASALKEYPDGSIIFLQDMGELGDPLIPLEVTKSILAYIAAHPRVTYLLVLKCTNFYLRFIEDLRKLPNIIYGATIETNNFIPAKISKAPSPMSRFIDMSLLRRRHLNARIMVSVEPIMDFNLDSFAAHIASLKPELVACGYDNHPGNHPETPLPEPKLEKTLSLIARLEEKGIKVYRKTIREARSCPSGIS